MEGNDNNYSDPALISTPSENNKKGDGSWIQFLIAPVLHMASAGLCLGGALSQQMKATYTRSYEAHDAGQASVRSDRNRSSCMLLHCCFIRDK